MADGMIAHDTPALDYERVKDFFYQKLADDRHGRGRMESAFFHTAQWIFLQGVGAHADLVAEIDRLRAQCKANPRDDERTERLRDLARSLLDPERNGWSVSQEVREHARRDLA